MDLAWKMLDLARAISEKHSRETIDMVDILSALAEVSLERGIIYKFFLKLPRTTFCFVTVKPSSLFYLAFLAVLYLLLVLLFAISGPTYWFLFAEDIETSLSDYEKALTILESVVEPDSRYIAELYPFSFDEVGNC